MSKSDAASKKKSVSNFGVMVEVMKSVVSCVVIVLCTVLFHPSLFTSWMRLEEKEDPTIESSKQDSRVVVKECRCQVHLNWNFLQRHWYY